MQNKWIFDWNIVIALDPDYKQYLENENNIYKSYENILFSTNDCGNVDKEIINTISDNSIQPNIPINFHQPLQLKPQHKYKINKKPVAGQKLLYPPKRILAAESILVRNNVEYHVYNNQYKKATSVIKFHTIENDKFIKAYKTVYTSFWEKNIFSQKRGLWQGIVFNKKTKFISLLTKVQLKKKGKYIVRIERLGYYRCPLNTTLLIKFYNKLKAYEKTTSNNYFIEKFNVVNITQLLISLNTQQKIKHPLKLTTTFLTNIEYFLRNKIDDYDFNNDLSLTTIGSKNGNKNVKKLTPALQKYPDIDQILNILLGKYKEKYITESYKQNVYLPGMTLISFFFTKNNEPYYLFLKRWYIETLNKKTNLQNLPKILSIYTTLHFIRKKINAQTIENYLTFHREFLKNKENNTISIEVWVDMYSMAKQYNTRIRKNKFYTNADVIAMHDKLVKIQNRDKELMRNKIEFQECKAPTKQYDGFEFVFIKNGGELAEEGRMMHHCIGGYVESCRYGNSIIFSMRKNNLRYVTIELNGQSKKLDIFQKYSIHNTLVKNAKILNLIHEWHSDLVQIHKNGIGTYEEGACRQVRTKNIRDNEQLIFPFPEAEIVPQ